MGYILALYSYTPKLILRKEPFKLFQNLYVAFENPHLYSSVM